MAQQTPSSLQVNIKDKYELWKTLKVIVSIGTFSDPVKDKALAEHLKEEVLPPKTSSI